MTRPIAAAFHRTRRARWLLILAALTLSGCMQADGRFNPFRTAEPSAPPTDYRFAADPDSFTEDNVALWNGQTTQAGAWIAHPDAVVARRVRITNTETGAQVDAAMFSRDSAIAGSQISVSAAAAQALGLIEGHATPITIVALRYRTSGEIAEAEAASRQTQEATPEAVPNTTAGPTVPPDQEPTPDAIEVTETQPDPAIEIGLLDEADGDPSEDGAKPTAIEEPAALESPVAPDTETDELTAAIEAALESLSAEDATTPPATPAETPPTSPAATQAEIPAASAPGPDTPVPQPRPQRVLAAETSSEALPTASPEGAITDGQNFVLAGTYATPDEAAALADRLWLAGLTVEIRPLTRGTEQLSRVLAGPYDTVAERDAALATVRQAGVAGAAPSGG